MALRSSTQRLRVAVRFTKSNTVGQVIDISSPLSDSLESSPAPAGVHHLSLEPERWIGQRLAHHLHLTPRRFVAPAQLVDDLQGRDPPPRPRRSSPHHLGGGFVTYLLQPAALEQRR